MAKISVIVPVYKVENYIDNCINSILNQTFADIELILVDDGSPDKCPEICDQYAEKDKRIRVLHKSNAGVSAARNDGLKLATGKYVIFCDSDDWMEISGLEKLYNKAEENNADIVIGDVYLSKNDSNQLVHFYDKNFITSDHKYITELIKCDMYRTYCPNPPSNGPAFGYGGPWNKLVKRELIVANDIKFDLSVKGVFDDILYTADILSYASIIAYVQEPVYYYRIIESSITHTFKPNVIEINDAIFKAWRKFIKKQNNSNVYMKAYYACVIRRLEESIKLYFVNPKNDKESKVLSRELKELVKSEPYRSAIKNVETKKLSKKQRLLVILGKMNLIQCIFALGIYK